MNDPGATPITVSLLGENLPLKLTRRGLRRAEYESRTPLFGASGSQVFWEQLALEPKPFQIVVLMYAALCHLGRFTFDQVDEAMDVEKSVEYMEALVKCLQRDFPAPAADAPAPEAPEESPFVPPTTTG
jgi:hypothetical protein